MAAVSWDLTKCLLMWRMPVVLEAFAVFKILAVCVASWNLTYKKERKYIYCIFWLHKIRICLYNTVLYSSDWETH